MMIANLDHSVSYNGKVENKFFNHFLNFGKKIALPTELQSWLHRLMEIELLLFRDALREENFYRPPQALKFKNFIKLKHPTSRFGAK